MAYVFYHFIGCFLLENICSPLNVVLLLRFDGMGRAILSTELGFIMENRCNFFFPVLRKGFSKTCCKKRFGYNNECRDGTLNLFYP